MSIPKDEPERCVFYFNDGRRCSMPGFAGDMGLCYYHAHKYQHQVNAEQFGALMGEGAYPVESFLPAFLCDLCAPLCSLW